MFFSLSGCWGVYDTLKPAGAGAALNLAVIFANQRRCHKKSPQSRAFFFLAVSRPKLPACPLLN
jgi:hypothetical protein